MNYGYRVLKGGLSQGVKTRRETAAAAAAFNNNLPMTNWIHCNRIYCTAIYAYLILNLCAVYFPIAMRFSAPKTDRDREEGS